MIFTIAPLVQEASGRKRWLATLGVFTGALVVVLALFGAAVAWAGAAVAARVTTPWAREAIAASALTMLGVLALAVALGELGLTRPLLPRIAPLADRPLTRSAWRRALIIALAFGATMAIFSPLSAYAMVIGWVAARQSAWLGAAALAAYGLGLVAPLAMAGSLAVGRDAGATPSEAFQARVRLVGGVSLAVAGGFLLSIWLLRATWALFEI